MTFGSPNIQTFWEPADHNQKRYKCHRSDTQTLPACDGVGRLTSPLAGVPTQPLSCFQNNNPDPTLLKKCHKTLIVLYGMDHSTKSNPKGKPFSSPSSLSSKSSWTVGTHAFIKRTLSSLSIDVIIITVVGVLIFIIMARRDTRALVHL